MKEILNTPSLEGYGKKLKNRIYSAFDESPLQVMGVDGESSKVQARQLVPFVPEYPMTGKPVLEQAEFNGKLPMVLNTLMYQSSAIKHSGYVIGIGGSDISILPAVAAGMAATKKSEGVVFRVVMGATDEMPLRALSYMLPSLQLMEELQQAGVEPPQLQVVSAHNISGSLNGKDIKRVEEQAELFGGVARDYVAEFFPKLEGSVTFLKDKPIQKGTVIRDQLIAVARSVKEGMSESTQKDLEGKGGNNGAARIYRFYAGAHVLVHDAAADTILQPLLPGVPDAVTPTTVISVGGKKEEIFYKLRHEVKPFLGEEFNSVDTLQYFTNHHVPPYFMARGGDIGLADLLHGVDQVNEIAKAASHDLIYLNNTSYFRGNLDKFIEGQKRKIASKS